MFNLDDRKKSVLIGVGLVLAVIYVSFFPGGSHFGGSVGKSLFWTVVSGIIGVLFVCYGIWPNSQIGKPGKYVIEFWQSLKQK